ncbi:hypothetical protein [Wielerella bovis]|uniref:hypothetical protein n=1 Tax=Wielerella bovis TaxID=2917790 RepID=UPI00201950CB|nr:hypothetical protein [Wielerella bovis]ULJ60414.1 hypothetical protein MIS44_00515 [Wielerella bovis]
MITLDLPPQTVQMIEQIAQQKGQSLQDFIMMSVYEKALQVAVQPQQNDELLADFIQTMPKAELTQNGLDIQMELRDEWH